jgi:hypothetical protein
MIFFVGDKLDALCLDMGVGMDEEPELEQK